MDYPRLSITALVNDWLDRNEGRAPDEAEPLDIPGFRLDGFTKGGRTKIKPDRLSRSLTVILKRLT